MKDFCMYLRVSTQKQGRTQLGIEAQRKMCNDFVNAHGGEVVAEYMDVESGTHRDRKGLWDAINYCKQNGCALVIAKLDRLCRDVEFCFKVMNTGIEIHFTDMPVLNTMILGVFASVAQYERELCSDRTRKALAAKKAQGAKLGGSNDKFKQTMTKDKMRERGKKAGATRSRVFVEGRDVVVFKKILQKVFGENWTWDDVTTGGGNKAKIFALMQDYKELEPTLFVGWDFNGDSRKLQIKLAGFIHTLKKGAKDGDVDDGQDKAMDEE